MVSTNQFKNGMHIEVDGTIFKIVEFQHVKPGKGGAFVRSKLKRAEDGAVIDKTFRAGEKFRPIRTETRKMQFLYADGSDAHFMDSETYDQLAIPEDSVKESLQWVMPNEVVELLYVDEQPSDVQVPSAVELAVTDTEPGVKGDTASGGGHCEVGVAVCLDTGDLAPVDRDDVAPAAVDLQAARTAATGLPHDRDDAIRGLVRAFQLEAIALPRVEQSLEAAAQAFAAAELRALALRAAGHLDPDDVGGDVRRKAGEVAAVPCRQRGLDQIEPGRLHGPRLTRRGGA